MSDEPIDVEDANETLSRLPAVERIRWAAEQFGEHAVMLASMQKSSSLMMHMMHSLGLDNEVLFVDTGLHFHETLKTRDELMRRYKLNIHTLYPKLTPSEQEEHYELKLYNYLDGQPDCCRMRKEEPFLDYVRASGHRLVMLGLGRSEGGSRAGIRPLEPDPRFGGYVLHPILEWEAAEVDAYINQHDIPLHPLHARNYPSIGCQVCTTPVTAGEDPRAGRWRHLRENGEGPKYCGLNFSDGGGI